jgi:hypothetical protein
VLLPVQLLLQFQAACQTHSLPALPRRVFFHHQQQQQQQVLVHCGLAAGQLTKLPGSSCFRGNGVWVMMELLLRCMLRVTVVW